MKNLNKILEQICTLSNQVMSYADAISKGINRYLTIEYNSSYGGYRLVNVSVGNGGHSGAFNESSCCSRRPIKQMTSYLDSILCGLEYSQKRI
jgi:hypothetical protein